MATGNLNAGPGRNLNGPDASKRQRNTSTSNQSRNQKAYDNPPSVGGLGASFGSAAGISSGLAGAWAALQNTLGAMRSQRIGLRAQFKTDRANLRSEAVGSMSEAINAGIEGGMTGSSAVGQNKIGVEAGLRADIETAAGTMQQGVLDTKIQETQAIQSFEIANASAEMQAAAMRQQQAIADAALAAQEEGQANMLAALEDAYGGGNGEGGTIAGRPVTELPNGDFKVGPLTFKSGTPESVIKRALQEYHLNTTPGPGNTGPTYNQIIAAHGG